MSKLVVKETHTRVVRDIERGPAGPVYMDISDGILGNAVDSALALFKIPRSMRWFIGGISCSNDVSANLTITIMVNNVAKGTLMIPTSSRIGTLSNPVSMLAGDTVKLVLTNSNGAIDLNWYLCGELI